MEENHIKIRGHAYSWKFEDCFIEDNIVEIRVWCINDNSEPFLVRIRDFRPFFIIHLDNIYINSKGQKVEVNWNSCNYISQLIDYIKYRLDQNEKTVSTDLENSIVTEMETLFYFTNGHKQKCLVLIFKNIETLKYCNKILSYEINLRCIGKPIQLKCSEGNIDPIRKFLAVKKMKACQWALWEGLEVPLDNKVTIYDSDKEIFVKWGKGITPISLEDSKGLATDPMIVSMDIEAVPADRNSFPNAFMTDDKVFIITLSFGRISKLEDIKKYALVLSSTFPIIKKELNIIVEIFDTEIDMIYRYVELMIENKAVLQTGYNIFGFDFKYLNDRLRRRADSWPKIGYVKNSTPEFKNISWGSRAYGSMNYYNLSIEGMINIDLYSIITRDYKLNNYKLETASQFFLGKGKEDMLYKVMFGIYDKVDKLNNNQELYNEVEKEKILIDFGLVIEYAVTDTTLVIELARKLNTWISIIELSNVTGINPVELITRGQSIRFLSLMYTKCKEKNIILDLPDPRPKENFCGALVGTPIPGKHDNVMTLDFKSLYPSIIIAHNLCFSTFVRECDRGIIIKREDCEIHEWEEEFEEEIEIEIDPDTAPEKIPKRPKKKKEIKVNKYCNWFVKKEIYKGIIPEIEVELIREREEVRKALKSEKKDSVPYVIGDEKQKGLKICCNSIYGALGSQFDEDKSTLSMIEIARTVTYLGRKWITWANEYLMKTHNATIVYGDTDSTMFQIPGVKEKECNEWGEKMEKELSSHLPPPLYLEFEKAGKILCFGKKKYCYVLLDHDGNYLPYSQMLVKGIILAKRDTCKFQKDTYREILEMVLDNKNAFEVYLIIIQKLFYLLSGNVPFIDLVVTMKMGKDYKSDNYCMNVFKNELTKRGRNAPVNERIEFLVCYIGDEREKDKKDKIKIGEKYVLLSEYRENLSTELHKKIDYMFYGEHYLQNCLDDLFDTVFSVAKNNNMKIPESPCKELFKEIKSKSLEYILEVYNKNK